MVLGAFFVFLAPLSARAMIVNGMPAIDLLGRYNTTAYSNSLVPTFTTAGYNAFGKNDLSSPGFGGGNMAIDTVNHLLFVSDFSNRRVLVFALNTDNSFNSHSPAYVLGQPDYDTGLLYPTGTTTPAASATTTNSTRGLAYDVANQRLFVADGVNNRVLVFSLSSGISNGMAASFVLGQSSFTASASATSQSGMWTPAGLVYDASSTRLFVADSSNNRTMIFDLSSGITNGQNAAFVLGQPDFTTRFASASQVKMSAPLGLTYDAAGNRLFVADSGNHRVLSYGVASPSNGQNATNVLGQTDFSGYASATSQIGMNAPSGLAWDSSGARLFVSESTNRRVTVFGTVANGQNADYVLGKSDFVTSTALVTQTGMSNGAGLAYDTTNNRLYVADSGNARILTFSGTIAANAPSALDEVGQYDATSTDPFSTTVIFTKGDSLAPNRANFSTSTFTGAALDSVHHRLYIPDRDSNRVDVYNLNSDDTLQDKVIDYEIGNPNFNVRNISAAASQTQFNTPEVARYDAVHDRLFVGDRTNNRVMVFDVSGTLSDGMAATYVIGEPNFTTSGGGLTQSTMNSPRGMTYDSTNDRLFVADTNGHRLLIFDFSVTPIATGMNATYVIGQPNFTSGTAGTTQATMSGPIDSVYEQSTHRLFVSETNNSRILVFDLTNGISNGMSASYVIGQANFTTGTANQGGSVGQNTQNGTLGLSYDYGRSRLFAADFTNNRVLVYDVATTTNNMNASYVIGQTSFGSNSLYGGNTAGPNQMGLYQPRGVLYDSTNDRLYVGDFNTGRVMVYDVATSTGTTSPTLDNSVTLSSYAAGASATATISFQLMHNLSSLLTVALPSGFTVTSAATVGASSACLSGFGFTSSTLTASKTNCAGPITLGGAVVTNPSTGGSYTISWTNDDPGSALVTITGGSSGGGGQPATPSVTVIQPNGGESLTASQTYDIVWASGGTIDSYRLSYSSDNGTSWNLVASGLHGNFYNWTVPNITTSMARVRVQAFDGSGNLLASDDTNAPFAITGTPTSPPPPSEPPPPPPPAPTHNYDPAQETSGTPTIDADKGLVAAANPACQPGTAFRGTRPTVYYCGIDGKRYAFPNSKTWFTWFPDFSNVIVLPNATISAIPLAPTYATYKPGVRMVKLQTNSKVYAVARGGVLRLVPSEQTAFDLYGPNWNTKIDDIPAPFWSSYTIGAPIN